MSMVRNEGASSEFDDETEAGNFDIVAIRKQMAPTWKRTVVGMILGAALGFGASFLIAPRYTATSVFLPPQQQGGSAALASLGALSSLVGAGASTKSSPEQYISLMQSVTVSDRIIKKFDLQKVWDERYMVDARKKLAKVADITTNKKDGLIKVDVTDTNPERAAAIANQYIDELRTFTNGLAVTEAQQRRVFFEQLLQQTRDKLAAAQASLEGSGYNAGALNAEPRAAAEGYAQLQASLTAAQVKLQVLRNSLADTAPEVSRQRETVDALSAQIAKLEAADRGQSRNSDYINRYREFKYQETLFDLFAKQYETARVDEGREGGLIQVVDTATPPERKAWPNRYVAGAIGALLVFFGFFVRAAIDSRRRPLQPMEL